MYATTINEVIIFRATLPNIDLMLKNARTEVGSVVFRTSAYLSKRRYIITGTLVQQIAKINTMILQQITRTYIEHKYCRIYTIYVQNTNVDQKTG